MIFECVPKKKFLLLFGKTFCYYLYQRIGLNVVRYRTYLVCSRVFHILNPFFRLSNGTRYLLLKLGNKLLSANSLPKIQCIVSKMDDLNNPLSYYKPLDVFSQGGAEGSAVQ